MSAEPSPVQPFDVEVARRDGLAIVHPRGELDMATAPRMRQVLEELRASKASVLLELDGLTFIDSTGLRLICDVHADSERDGVGLKLTAGPPQVMRVFDLTKLTPRLPFVH